MSTFSSSSLLAVLAIVGLLCQCCTSAPHPCCPGSQHVVAMMSDYASSFSASMPKALLCSSAKGIAKALEGRLGSVPGCPRGGGSALADEIYASLPPTDDECSRSLGFVRAMFAVAASAASHAGANGDWAKLAERFSGQVKLIDENSAQLSIDIGKVGFTSPKAGDHARVPDMHSVIDSPGQSGSHKANKY